MSGTMRQQHAQKSLKTLSHETRRTTCGATESKLDLSYNKHLVVVAIDFGTVHSGFAYSFLGNEDEIQTAKHGGILEEDRVPTVLLLHPCKTFHSFGYEAQRNYSELDKIDRKQYFFVENFKMEIYINERIERKMKMRDISGKKIKVMKVFSMAIGHLKRKAQEIVLQSKLGLKVSDIKWMITIPAISTDSVRQFMREAIIKAGISSEHMQLVLEPEAAALYCKPRFTQGQHPVGFKYILADLGGGTSDICVHEIISDEKLREIYRATGETVGGSNVDYHFIHFMEELVGEHVWAEFKSKHTFAYVSLMNEFRLKKKDFQQSSKTTTLRMENALLHVLSEHMQSTLTNIIDLSNYSDKVRYLSIEGRLIINKELMEQFFKPSVDGIIAKLREILNVSKDSNINTILLVGGYSESLYLRERMQAEFKDMIVIIVTDTRLAVLKGGVMMGWKPKNIIQRRSRFTYGFPVMKPFINGKHLECQRRICDGEVWCDEIFEKIIEKGQTVEYGQAFIYKGYSTAYHPEEKHKRLYQSLFKSSLENPKYCTKEGESTRVGNIVMHPPPEGYPDYWDNETHLIVGETEFTAKYFNLTTGHEYEAQMDFL